MFVFLTRSLKCDEFLRCIEQHPCRFTRLFASQNLAAERIRRSPDAQTRKIRVVLGEI